MTTYSTLDRLSAPSSLRPCFWRLLSNLWLWRSVCFVTSESAGLSVEPHPWMWAVGSRNVSSVIIFASDSSKWVKLYFHNIYLDSIREKNRKVPKSRFKRFLAALTKNPTKCQTRGGGQPHSLATDGKAPPPLDLVCCTASRRPRGHPCTALKV